MNNSVIRRFMPDSREWNRLDAAATTIKAFTGVNIKVSTCFFDYGQNWVWTTLLGESAMLGREYQMLDPKQQDIIINGTLEEFNKVVGELIDKLPKRGLFEH